MNFLQAILFVSGFGLLLLGAEFLVRGASRLAIAAGISPLVVGLTVVAYGTSAPELAVCVQSVLASDPQPDLAIGNVVGSNIANILLVLGISASVRPLGISQALIRHGVPLMIAVALATLLVSWNGTIDRIEGLTMFLCAGLFTVYSIRQSRRETKKRAVEPERFSARSRRSIARMLAIELGLITLGLFMLLLGADWLVTGAVVFARVLGVSELIIGLTVIAIGTSLPEIATSIVAGCRGQRDIAVGNVVGSNIFNLLLVLGLTATVAPHGVTVPPTAIRFDIIVMIAVSVACLPVFFTNAEISRWEGALFLAYYGCYTLFLFLMHTQHDALQPLSAFVLYFAIPLTAVTLIVLSWHYFHKTRPSSMDG